MSTNHRAWLRRPVLGSDAEAIVVLAAAIGQAAGVEDLMTAADVQADLEHPHVVLDRDTFAILDERGSLRAYAIVYDEVPGRTDGEILIDPSLDAATTDALLDECIAWYVDAVLLHAERRGVTSTVAVLAAAQVEAAMFAAYSRSGFTYARTFWRMGLQLSDPHPQPFGIDGIDIAHVDPADDAAMERLHLLNEAAFAEHYGYVPITAEVFSAQARAFAGFDPDALWIAVDQASGADAAYLIGTDRRADEGRGYIALLGVSPTFRGRGLAKALLATAFTYYEGRGMSAVELGVDAQNHTGATQLYRAVGMREWESFDVWELALTLHGPTG